MTDVLIAVVLVLGAMFLLALVVAGLVARRGLRALRTRSAALQPRLADARTRLLPPGARRDAAQMRGELSAEVQATRSLLGAAPQGLVFRADARALLQEIETTAAALELELSHIERFRDPDRQRAALAAVRPQVRQLIDSAYTARETVLRTAAADRERVLQSLQADIEQQAAALRRYRHARGEQLL